jgi:hypothetical protein
MVAYLTLRHMRDEMHSPARSNVRMIAQGSQQKTLSAECYQRNGAANKSVSCVGGAGLVLSASGWRGRSTGLMQTTALQGRGRRGAAALWPFSDVIDGGIARLSRTEFRDSKKVRCDAGVVRDDGGIDVYGCS